MRYIYVHDRSVTYNTQDVSSLESRFADGRSANQYTVVDAVTAASVTQKTCMSIESKILGTFPVSKVKSFAPIIGTCI
jgi:hypothetical protein